MATPYDGLTPDDVAYQRKYGQNLMQQGADISPVGHWTQALARALQGGIGGYTMGQAGQAEREGKASANQLLAQALQGGDTRKTIGAMLSNPWSADTGTKLAQTYIGQQMQPQTTDDIKEYEYAKRNGGTGSFTDWMKSKREGSLKYGLNPIPFQKPDGSIGYMVPNTSGGSQELSIPNGGVAMPKATTVQTPTEVITRDQFGRDIRRENKDVAGAAEQKEIGEARGKAAADLPRVIDNAELALQTIEQVRSHPGKPYAIGAASILPGIPGTQQKGFIELSKQLEGKAFLEAFNSLKGGGAITEIEGTKATNAIARLNRAQNQQDYDQALTDLENVIYRGLARARQAAGRSAARFSPGAAAAPAGSGGWSARKLD